MMPPEPRPAGRARLWTGLFAFLVTLIVGGGAAYLLIDGYKARVDASARRDAMVIGTTVARTLAQQFEKAARSNIPLKLLPGVDAYLAETLSGTPGITQIVLRGGDGREIRSAIGPESGTDSVSVPVAVDGLPVASVDVTTNPAALSTSFGMFRVKAAVAVLICAAFSGVLGALLAGARLDRQRSRLAEALARTAAENFTGGSQDTRRTRALRHGAVGRAFRALLHGNRRLIERQSVFEAYAEELLAVDFDGALRPDVERVRREVLHKPAETEKGRSL